MSAAATEVLVVVDPTAPGAALVPGPDGRVLAEEVLAAAVRDVGQRAEPVAALVDEPSLTAAADVVVARLRASSERPLAVVDAALVTPATVHGDVVAEPDGRGRVLRDAEARVVALRVAAADRERLADAVQERSVGWTPGRLLDALAAVAADLRLATREVTPGDFPLTLAQTAAEADAARAALADLDEPGLRLRRASRADDGFLSTFLVRPLSRRLTRHAVARGLAPATVTGVALLLGVLAAAAYAVGGRGWLVVGSVLLLTSLVVDCVDGEVARYTRTTSPRGGWLDVGADRVKEYAVYWCLAFGAAGWSLERGHRAVWWLAVAALALLVTRHFVDFGFAARQAGEEAALAASGGVAAWSQRTDARAAVRYAKRAVIAPVGERTIVLAVLAPVVGVRWTFVVLLAMGVVAGAWTTAGRLGRALAGGAAVTSGGDEQLRTQVDAAPVPRSAWPVGGRLGWLLPAASRALEQGGVAALTAWLAPRAVPGVLAWLAVVAIAEYELTYRGRLTGSATPSGPLAWLGWPVRLVGAAVLLAVVPGAAGVVLAVAAGVLAAGVLVASQAFWARSVRSAP